MVTWRSKISLNSWGISIKFQRRQKNPHISILAHNISQTCTYNKAQSRMEWKIFYDTHNCCSFIFFTPSPPTHTQKTRKKYFEVLTCANEYNIIRFASWRFYLWINSNLCEAVPVILTKDMFTDVEWGFKLKLTVLRRVLKLDVRSMRKHFHPSTSES